MTQITITLNKILAHDPCSDGWENILKGRGKADADDEEFPLSEALQSNSLEDVLWALCCLPEHDRLWRKFAVWCARQVQHLMTDERSIAALEVALRHSNGEATDEELQAAWADACDANDAAWTAAAWTASAARAASAAAWTAWTAWAAARAAALDVACDARASAWTAANGAARDAASAARAARDAASAARAARASAWDAAWAAALDAANDAVWAAASDAQKAKLIQILDAGEWVE